MVLGLTHDDPLPDVSRKHLVAYHRFLASGLKFPFKAKDDRDGMPLTIQRLFGRIVTWTTKG